MKLHYFIDPNGNFGDDLNAHVWRLVAPELLDDRDDELLVGIGTLINHRLPRQPIKHILGSGLGYGDPPPVDHTFRWHALRGYKTARALGLSTDLVVTDGAVLIRRLPLPTPLGHRRRFGVILTGHTVDRFDWAKVCEEADMLYISSRWSVDRVLGLMQQCDVILAEAMHGAIVADALRIPWIPISCSRIILEFKWQDWLSSLNLSYEAHPVTPLISVEWASAATQGSWLKRGVKRALSSIGVWSRDWGDRPEAPSKPETVSVASSDLRAAARSRPVLSDISILQRRACQFDAVLEPLIEQKIRGK